MHWLSSQALLRHSLPMGYRLHTTSWLIHKFYEESTRFVLIAVIFIKQGNKWSSLLENASALKPGKAHQPQENWDNYSYPWSPGSVNYFLNQRAAEGVALEESICEESIYDMWRISMWYVKNQYVIKQWLSTGSGRPGLNLSSSLAIHVTLDYLTYICHLVNQMRRKPYQLQRFCGGLNENGP